MNEEIEKQLASMLSRIEALEAKTKKTEADTMEYIDDHLQEHLHLHKMIYPAFFKTHPEAHDSMQQIHEILEKKSGGTDDPKS